MIRSAAPTGGWTRTSRPLRRFQDSEYAEWYAAQRARFNEWGYRWHFGVWQLGPRGLLPLDT